MGRKRIDVSKRKSSISISIETKLRDKLQHDPNGKPSHIVETLVKDYFNGNRSLDDIEEGIKKYEND